MKTTGRMYENTKMFSNAAALGIGKHRYQLNEAYDKFLDGKDK